MKYTKAFLSIISLGGITTGIVAIIYIRNYSLTDFYTKYCKTEHQRQNFVVQHQESKSSFPEEDQNNDFRKNVGRTEDIEQRKQFVKRYCLKLSKDSYWVNLKPTGQLWSYANISYCIPPKIGCTFWKRAFRYLASDYKETNGSVLQPSDIDRFQVHYGPIRNLTTTRINTQLAALLLSTGKSFMFTRNPYSRLWSAFIDKFLLPDFWITAAIKAAKVVRPQNATVGLSCVTDITLEEFLSHITLLPTDRLNLHWMPVHRICSPCHVNFDVIGKQETFSADTAYIINKFGLEKIAENADEQKRFEDEIKMLVTYNFHLEKGRKKCFQKLLVAKRLWLAFQYNGYIHRNIALPIKRLIDQGFEKDATNSFLEIVWETIDSHTDDMKRDLKKQKKAMMIEAFRTVPSDILDRLKTIYHYDFELFQYHPEVDIL